MVWTRGSREWGAEVPLVRRRNRPTSATRRVAVTDLWWPLGVPVAVAIGASVDLLFAPTPSIFPFETPDPDLARRVRDWIGSLPLGVGNLDGTSSH